MSRSTAKESRDEATARGGAQLGAGSLVLADSSALLYLAEGEASSPRRVAVERFLAEAAERGLRLAVSTIAWTELLEGPLARGDRGFAEAYRRLLSDSGRILVRELDVAVAEEAAALAAALPPDRRRKLSTGDIIHIATAIVLGAEAILTNDEAWASVPRCPRLLLVDELAAGLDAWA